MTRSSIIWTGLLGLAGAIILTTLCLLLMLQGWIPVLLTQPLLVWGLFLFLLTLSVLEIPVMIFAMRRMIASPNPRAGYVLLVTNVAYVTFAAVYAAPFILLAGGGQQELAAGALLASLSLIRFISAMVFLPYEKKRP